MFNGPFSFSFHFCPFPPLQAGLFVMHDGQHYPFLSKDKDLHLHTTITTLTKDGRKVTSLVSAYLIRCICKVFLAFGFVGHL